jgi:ribosomal protein S14
LIIDRHNTITAVLVKQKSRNSKRLSKSFLKNFCTLTGRGSAVVQKFAVNRFIIRDLVRFGLIRGLMHERIS